MNEPMKAVETARAPVENRADTTPVESPQAPRVITDPREIAAIVMAQTSVVNAKKDELAKAIKTLSEMTQQLVVAYANQARFIERIAQRAKALEGKPNGSDTNQLAA